MRNPFITTLKAIAIILVVLAHSGCPTYLARISYMLCISLFFMASGYCFNTKYLNDEAAFVKRRFKGLYVPFLMWSVFFLVLNRFWFWTGLLNEQYGNSQGGVTHPLDLHNWLQSLWSIVFNMSGYDEFLCGAYWFFRALLVASIAFLVGMKIIGAIRWFREKHSLTALTVAAISLVLALWQTSDGLKITGLVQGGYRELMGVFFIAAGFLYRQLELWLETPARTEDCIADNSEYDTYKRLAIQMTNKAVVVVEDTVRTYCAYGIVSLLINGVILGLLVYYPHPSFGYKATALSSVLWLAFSGVVGFSFTYNFSKMLRRIIPLRKPLIFIGENTLYIFGWHLLAFKFVSMIKVGVYKLPWLMVGGHTVVHSEEGGWFWILYAIFGIALPLGVVWLWRYCKACLGLDSSWMLIKTGAKWLFHMICIGAVAAGKGIAKGSVLGVTALSDGLVNGCQRLLNFCIKFVDTIKSSADLSQDGEEIDDDNEAEYQADDEEEDDDEEEEYEEEYDEEEDKK